mmetsp:Transcript_23523/g.70646  ORF Transcript_23523/g.70646 Transcript_23523/m.70646 type:complete len:223 (-) Transcript_23523:1479-2147(-)
MTAAAPSSWAIWLKSTVAFVPACDVPTQIGKPGAAATAHAIRRSRSLSVRRLLSPSTPTIVQPAAPVVAMNSTLRRNPSRSSDSSSRNGVAMMGQTPRYGFVVVAVDSARRAVVATARPSAAGAIVVICSGASAFCERRTRGRLLRSRRLPLENHTARICWPCAASRPAAPPRAAGRSSRARCPRGRPSTRGPCPARLLKKARTSWTASGPRPPRRRPSRTR